MPSESEIGAKRATTKTNNRGKYFYVYSNLLLNFFSEFLNLQNLKNLSKKLPNFKI